MSIAPQCRRPMMVGFIVANLGLFALGCTTDPASATSAQRKAAELIFFDHCSSSGEKIVRTANNVDGILILKPRSGRLNYDRQFDLDDPYGADLRGDDFIKSFLRGNDSLPRTSTPSLQRGYRYVDVIEPVTNLRYRYSGSIEEEDNSSSIEHHESFILSKTYATLPPPRFAVTYEDISTDEDRRHWIAGSLLKIIDLQNGEVMAERVGYMMDPYQGSKAGGRAPWLMAADHACPAFTHTGNYGAQLQIGQTDRFVEKVLIPTRGRKQ